jgi:hypothetical protein
MSHLGVRVLSPGPHPGMLMVILVDIRTYHSNKFLCLVSVLLFKVVFFGN